MKLEKPKGRNVKFAAALVAVILLSVFVGIQIGIGGPIATTNYYLETPVNTADYYVYRYSNGSYCAINGSNWDNFLVSSNASDVINTCLDSLTSGRVWQEKVLVMGNVTITNPIQISSWTVLQIEGVIKLADGANCNMIENKHPSTYDVNIKICGNGYLDGNYGNQGAGDYNGIDIVWGTNPATLSYIYIQGINIYYPKKHGIYIDLSGSGNEYVWIHDTKSKAAEYGVYCIGVSDMMVEHSYFGGWVEGFAFASGSHLIMDNVYINYPVHFYSSADIVMSNFLIDMGVNDDALKLEGVYDSSFSGGRINYFGTNGYNTKSAIKLSSAGGTHSRYNTFSGINIGHLYASTSKWKYGIEETDSNQNYNSYSAITGYDMVTATLRKLGAGSEYAAIVGGVVET